MGYSIAQKIIAKAAGRDSITPGEIVTCQVDLALLLDSGGPRRIWPRLKELGTGVRDPDKIVVVTRSLHPGCRCRIGCDPETDA